MYKAFPLETSHGLLTTRLSLEQFSQSSVEFHIIDNILIKKNPTVYALVQMTISKALLIEKCIRAAVIVLLQEASK